MRRFHMLFCKPLPTRTLVTPIWISLPGSSTPTHPCGADVPGQPHHHGQVHTSHLPAHFSLWAVLSGRVPLLPSSGRAAIVHTHIQLCVSAWRERKHQALGVQHSLGVPTMWGSSKLQVKPFSFFHPEHIDALLSITVCVILDLFGWGQLLSCLVRLYESALANPCQAS